MLHDHRLADAARAETAIAPAPARRWWPGLIGLWLVACAWLLADRAGQIATLRLPDSDDDMRLLQVRDWLAGQGWFDLRQYRLDPPAGADIHWSRLVDLPLAAVIRPLAPLVGMHGAETVAAVAVPLLTLLAAMALLAGIARRTVAPGAWWWAPLLLLLATPALDMMAPLRIDHHGWQIVAVLAMLFGLTAADRWRGGVAAGLAIAASLTIGLEMLPFLALGAAAAAIGWVIDPREGVRLRGLCMAAGVGTIVALFAFVPPAQRFGFGCDALSASFALPLLAGVAVLGLAARRPMGRAGRIGWLVTAGVAAVLPLLLAGGALCLIDPYHAVDPQARRLWLDSVSEALPLWRQSAEVAWASLMLPAIGLAGAAAMLRVPGPKRAWAILLAMAILSIALALAATRGAVIAQALALPGAAALGWRGRAWLAAHRSMPVRVFGTVLLFLTVSAILPRLLIAATLSKPESKTEIAAGKGAAACMTPRALAALNALPAGTMFGFLDNTPALLLHTHHKGIAGPYHRNGRAIADVMRAWAGSPAAAEAIVRRHHADYVIACGSPAEAQLYDRRGPDGLHARLMRGQVPGWLAPVSLNPVNMNPVNMNNAQWRIWRVRAPLRAGGGSA